MPKKLVVEIYVDNPKAAEFKSVAKSVPPLQEFLTHLDGITVPQRFFWSGSSDGMPTQLPLQESITVNSPDQARALAHILYGWTLLSILKRVVIRSDKGRAVITHETLEVDEEISRLL
jgi:hypothetical protein